VPRDSILLCGIHFPITVAYLRRARLIPWCQLRISGHVEDATALLPHSVTTKLWTAARAHNSRPLLSEACMVQILKNYLRLIRGSMILDHIRTRFLGGRLIRESDLYASIYGTHKPIYYSCTPFIWIKNRTVNIGAFTLP